MSDILKELVLRPNLNNQGTLPEFGECLDKCPDILCAGNEPIADFRKELATAKSYLSEFKDKYVPGHINYIYIRVKNNSEEDLNDVYAELFYCDAEHVSSVSNWKRIPVENRKLSSGGNPFDVIKANAIGVVEAPFMLPPDLEVNRRFCLIARIWSDKFNDKMPDESSPTYIENLIFEHLWWGQKNFFISNNNNDDCPFSCFSISLSIPVEFNLNNIEDERTILLKTSNVLYNNIKVEVCNSRTDDNGKVILFPKTTIDRECEFFGPFKLHQGYSSQMTLYIYRPAGQRPNSNEKYKLYISKGEQPLNNIKHSAAEIDYSQFSCISTFTFNTEF